MTFSRPIPGSHHENSSLAMEHPRVSVGRRIVSGVRAVVSNKLDLPQIVRSAEPVMAVAAATVEGDGERCCQDKRRVRLGHGERCLPAEIRTSVDSSSGISTDIGPMSKPERADGCIWLHLKPAFTAEKLTLVVNFQ